MNNKKIYMALVACVAGIISFTSPALSVELPEVKQDKGVIIFYRLSSFKGKAIRFNINHSEGSAGQLLSGTYLYLYLKPGEHKFWSQAISQDSISINVQAGKKYYVKGEVLMGVFAGRPRFTHMPEAEALADLDKLK